MRAVSKRLGFKITLVYLVFFAAGAHAQRRGDLLAFQGLSHANDLGVKATALGGAFTALTGDVSSLFHNPAGLADIQNLKISVSANGYDKGWRENQVYRPNRFFITLPFYLEGLYVPDPANNGLWDFEVFERERDSAYVVTPPELGLDPFSKAAADWQESRSDFVLNNIAAAMPVTIGDKKFVVSAGFSRQYDVLNFDRNDTYLNPHIGFDAYGVAERVTTDTLRMDWFRFLRDRSGNIKNVTAAIAHKVNDRINLGFGFSTSSGDTQDRLSLEKVGWFDLVRNNRFRFAYDTLNTGVTGKSSFSATRFNFGATASLNKIRLGFNFVLPYTLKRTWDQTTTLTDTLETTMSTSSGVDRMEAPMTYSFGVSFMPTDRFMLSFDLKNTAYSNASFDLAGNDTTRQGWADQNIISFGAQYKLASWLALLAGFRNLPETFVPDGAAFKDRGPAADSYTFGLSLGLFYGRLDAAYEIRRLKYYDSYFSNTNYVLETYNNFSLGYTLDL